MSDLADFLLARIAEDSTDDKQALRRCTAVKGNVLLARAGDGLAVSNLRTWAAEYAEHPDYREEWRP